MKQYIDRLAVEIRFRAFVQDDRGQDLIEYALIVGFMVITVYIILPNNLMPTVSTIFSKIAAVFASAP